MIRHQQEYLKSTLIENGASMVGFGDISFLDNGFNTAISLGLKYDDRIVDRLHVDEASFHYHLLELKTRMEQLMDIAGDILSGWGCRYEAIIGDMPINDNEMLRNLQTFSHKTAATRAGLGWIGKCSLLITPGHGPRVRLGTILVEADLHLDPPVVRDMCGGCRLCAEACPCGAINNVNWRLGMDRGELFDAFLCNEWRLSHVPSLGRKHSCGLCMQACRVGMI